MDKPERDTPVGALSGADAKRFFVGHRSLADLMAEQGTCTIKDTSSLRGDFWPEEEPVEEFVAALYAWRGRSRRDSAA